jgi:hypothetical protein
MLDPDRQIADPPAGRMKDGIGDGRCHADQCDLAEAFDAKRIDVRVLLLDEVRLAPGTEVPYTKSLAISAMGTNSRPLWPPV